MILIMLTIAKKYRVLNSLLTVYRKHLKTHKRIHDFLKYLWHTCFFLYLELKVFCTILFHSLKSRWRPIVSLSEFVQMKGLVSYKLSDLERVLTPTPRVSTTVDRSYLQSPHSFYIFPEISVSLLPNAVVCGGSNLLLVDEVVVCHDLLDFVTDKTMEELFGRIRVDPGSQRIRWLIRDKNLEPLSVAASFLDACSSNYAHWLTEVLPRIVLFCAQERCKGIPIIINDGLHENIMESLYRVIGDDREVIKLSIGKSLNIDCLYTVSMVGYVPFEQRTTNASGFSHGKFSPYAFDQMSSILINSNGDRVSNPLPKKIFIRRNSGSRKVLNAPDLEKLLESKGYVTVEPETLTFSQQVQLFSNAEEVIGSSGAALANIIFCRPGTKITILMSRYLGSIYWYWQNMACVSGNVVQYCFGDQVENSKGGIHSDFFISPKEIAEIL